MGEGKDCDDELGGRWVEGVTGDRSCMFKHRACLCCRAKFDNDSAAMTTETEGCVTKKTDGILYWGHISHKDLTASSENENGIISD